MFTPRPALSTVAAEAGARARKADRSAWITKLLWALLPAAAIVVAGCGSSTTQPTPAPIAPIAPIVLTPGSTFDPHPFALSPDDSIGIINPAKASSAASKKPKPDEGITTSPTAPVINHWFYLVNGGGLPSTTPTSPFTPLVLTVSGPPPIGAPDPNGGDTVSGELMNPASTGRQLWKAVAAPGNTMIAPIFYLRSAMSFKTGVDDATYPSMLVGYGATGADLDLGYPPPYGTPGIYMNQGAAPSGSTTAPTVDNSAFQQWTYNESAQLTNLGVTQLLYEEGPSVAVGNGPVDVENQWYAYPSYYVEQVVSQPNSAPPFPAAQSPGEQAAYDWLSAFLDAPGSCLYGASTTPYSAGTKYNGIRCQYVNLSATTTLAKCASDAALFSITPADNPGQYMGVEISNAEFQGVSGQIANECTYAGDVQAMFGTYNEILTYVFAGAGDVITTLSGDVGISQAAVLYPVPTQIIEGTLYTMLGATGDPAAGVVANLMETGVNAAVAAPGSTLNASLKTTVGTLYTDLGTQFAVLQEQGSNGETAILEDWGRLSVIGPLTLKTGYNGLSISPDDEVTIKTQALKGYSLSVMQQLMQASGWNLENIVASLDLSYINSVPNYDKYTYSTFGPDAGVNLNASWLRTVGTDPTEPSAAVMTTDIQDNGGNMFELFNGLNGWSGMPNALGIENLECQDGGVLTTLFNATPTDLSVVVSPTEKAEVAEPGVNFVNTGNEDDIETAYSFELRPYGYLPIYSDNNLYTTDTGIVLVSVLIYDPNFSSPVGVFTITNTQSVSQQQTQSGYSFSPAGFNAKVPDCITNLSPPFGWWVTIVQAPQ